MQNEDIFDVVRDTVSEVCGVPISQIDGTTDFFELGFHSLMVTQLVARLQDRLDMDFTLRDLFTSPCVNGIVAMIESKRTESI
jgi:acyl carrier protein